MTPALTLVMALSLAAPDAVLYPSALPPIAGSGTDRG